MLNGAVASKQDGSITFIVCNIRIQIEFGKIGDNLTPCLFSFSEVVRLAHVGGRMSQNRSQEAMTRCGEMVIIPSSCG